MNKQMLVFMLPHWILAFIVTSLSILVLAISLEHIIGGVSFTQTMWIIEYRYTLFYFFVFMHSLSILITSYLQQFQKTTTKIIGGEIDPFISIPLLLHLLVLVVGAIYLYKLEWYTTILVYFIFSCVWAIADLIGVTIGTYVSNMFKKIPPRRYV